MFDSFYLAWKYIKFNKVKTAALIACITLVGSLPVSLNALLAESEQQLMQRARVTPLIVGSKGSDLDLAINTLYFGSLPPPSIHMSEVEAISKTELAVPIPLYLQFEARGFPIVGTTVEYFDFRNLSVERGQMFGVVGDAVVGSTVADRLGLKPGDSIVSSPQNLFDLGGIYPLKMTVVGVLETSHSPDDLGIFVDLKSTWIMASLGHGHQDLVKSAPTSTILSQEGNNIAANASLQQFTEITPDNLNSFHFHGDTSEFPITAILAVPGDRKSEDLLRGQYQLSSAVNQIVKPTQVVEELLLEIFKIRNILNGVFATVILATGLATVLIFNLSLRLRQREIETSFKLGCSRMTIAKLLAAEIAIVLVISVGTTGAIVTGLRPFNDRIIRVLIFNG